MESRSEINPECPYFRQFLFVVPIRGSYGALLFYLFIYYLTMETEHVKTVICDLDRTSNSRQFTEEIFNNDRFDVIGATGSYDEMERDIRRWNVVIGIYIPPDFSRNLGKNGRGDILALLDSVNGNQALTAFGYLKQIAAESALQLAPIHVQEEYLSKGGNVIINTHYWYNPELRSQAYMVPGIVVLIITIITLIELIIILKLADFIFGIHLAGSLFILYLIIFLYLFTSLGLGLFVSTLAKTQQQALFLLGTGIFTASVIKFRKKLT